MWIGGDERFSEETKAALIEVAADAWTHKQLNLLFRRLGVDDANDREMGNPTKVHRLEEAVDRLSGHAPVHGRDLLELVRTLMEERWHGDVSESSPFTAHSFRRSTSSLPRLARKIATMRPTRAVSIVRPAAAAAALCGPFVPSRRPVVGTTASRAARHLSLRQSPHRLP
jgi:hypothetical protein